MKEEEKPERYRQRSDECSVTCMSGVNKSLKTDILNNSVNAETLNISVTYCSRRACPTCCMMALIHTEGLSTVRGEKKLMTSGSIDRRVVSDSGMSDRQL